MLCGAVSRTPMHYYSVLNILVISHYVHYDETKVADSRSKLHRKNLQDLSCIISFHCLDCFQEPFIFNQFTLDTDVVCSV